MYAPITLLPFLLPLVAALPRGDNSQDLYDLAARDLSLSNSGHVAGKRAFAAGHDAKRMVRRKKQSTGSNKKRSCVANTSTSSVAAVTPTSVSVAPATTTTASSLSSTQIGDANFVATTVSTTPKSTSTSTSAAASAVASSAPASNSTVSTGGSGSSDPMMAALFPEQGSNWWTTYPNAPGALSINSALTPLQFGALPPEQNAPDGSDALMASFPANTFSINPSAGIGFSFYSQGADNGVNVVSGTDVLFSYSAYFPSGFDFVKGGKMPGLYGGTSLAEAKSCSGGRQTDRESCFSARLMWRTNGMGEFYNYYPTSIQQYSGYCSTPPMSVCNAQYGDSIGRGSFYWATGAWTTVAQRVKLNDVGQANGEQQLWVNGQPIMHLTGLQIITQTSQIYGIMAQTFFGGSDQSWASPTNQNAWFKDFSMTVLA